jgi:transcriptional regulator with XRE-family HTH domain
MHDEGIDDARARRITINEADAKLLGRNLAIARQRRGFSQGALAERAGITRDAVHKIEMGLRSPRIGTLLALADALGVGLGDLLAELRP